MEGKMESRLKLMRLSLLFVFCNFVLLYADLELVISNIPQTQSNTCWAACIRMIDKAYFNVDKGEPYWLSWGTSSQNVSNSITGTSTSVDKLLSDRISITNIAGSGTMLFDNATRGIKQEINANRPVLIRRSTITVDGHFLLITGYKNDANQTVILQDPSPVNQGSRMVKPYSELLEEPQNTTIRWTHTCRLTTSPRTPIPVGLYDWCRITSGPTTISPSTTSLSYTGTLHSVEMPPAHPVSWS
jgi:hypothetical protein